MINFNDAEKALGYLKSTDEEAARAKARLEALQEARKSVKAQLFLESDEKSAAAKEQSAYSDEMYIEHLKKIEDAVYDFEILRNRRKAAELQISLWMCVQKNQQQGNVL